MSYSQYRDERRGRKNPKQQNLYDEYGRMKEYDFLDICDCMSEECPGCWGICPKCKLSEKCGPVCRKNRNFYFESISTDGKEEVINNEYFQQHQ